MQRKLDLLENVKKKKETKGNKNERKTGASCPHCDGEIIERSFIPFIGQRAIYGPGGRNQATEKDRRVIGYHCNVCKTEFYGCPSSSKE